MCERGGLSIKLALKAVNLSVCQLAIDRPNVRGTEVMQLRNARVTAAVRMLLNKAVSAVDGVKVAGKLWEVQACTETTHGPD